MLFSKKYVFETRATRYKRYLKNLSSLFLVMTFIYGLSCLGFIYVSNKESEITKEKLFQKQPDLIAVYTGQSGRISYALEKAQTFPHIKVLISGVYITNSIKTLIANYKESRVSDEINTDFIEIDYLARNTVENVLYTLRYLRENKSYKNIIIISHDYHIMRIKHIIKKLSAQNGKFNFYFDAVKTDFTQWNNLKILFKEVFKFIRTWSFLLLWDEDTHLESHFI